MAMVIEIDVQHERELTADAGGGIVRPNSVSNPVLSYIVSRHHSKNCRIFLNNIPKYFSCSEFSVTLLNILKILRH